MAVSVIKRAPKAIRFSLAAGDLTNYRGWGVYDPVASTVRIYGYAQDPDNYFTTTTNLATIPADYRPSSAMGGVCIYCTSDGALRPYQCSFGADGSIKQSASAVAKRVIFFGEYTL